jgi:5-methylcytosine-specific restriction endonuclease McrA
MKVVVLSRDYLPITWCDVRRAVALVYSKKAEIVTESGLFLRSVSSLFPVPRVIRLLGRLVKHVQPKVTYTRRNVHIRDNYTCQYCGAREQLTLDHVQPVSRGGRSVWENVVTACSPCNARKGNKTPEEAQMPLHTQPRRPHLLMQIDWQTLFEPS